MRSNTEHDDVRLMKESELANDLGLSHWWCQRARVYGGGPPFVRIGSAVRYRPQDVADWLATQEAGATARA